MHLALISPFLFDRCLSHRRLSTVIVFLGNAPKVDVRDDSDSVLRKMVSIYRRPRFLPILSLVWSISVRVRVCVRASSSHSSLNPTGGVSVSTYQGRHNLNIGFLIILKRWRRCWANDMGLVYPFLLWFFVYQSLQEGCVWHLFIYAYFNVRAALICPCQRASPCFCFCFGLGCTNTHSVVHRKCADSTVLTTPLLRLSFIHSAWPKSTRDCRRPVFISFSNTNMC